MTGATAPAHQPAPESADRAKDDDVSKTAAPAAASYAGTFGGQAGEAARVRREIAAYLGTCPVTLYMILIASELTANAILHTRSRGSTLRVRCQLSPRAARIEVEDLGGPWRPRQPGDRPHGLGIVQALTGPDGWGTQPTGTGGRIVWARLSW
jgi:hypothetical protein